MKTVQVITVESLKREIQTLMTEYAVAGLSLVQAQNRDLINEVIGLLLKRAEIMKSIAHRQGMVIEMLQNQAKFRRVA